MTFCHLPAPLLVAVIKERTPGDAIAAITGAYRRGARAVDLHTSFLEEKFRNADGLRRIVEASPLPVMALNYSVYLDEGDVRVREESEEERTALFRAAVEAGAACIDLQNYSFDREAKTVFRRDLAPAGCLFGAVDPDEVTFDPRALERQRELMAYARAHGTEVLLSCHTHKRMDRAQILDLARHMYAKGPDAIKIVTWAETDEDVQESFAAIMQAKVDIPCNVHLHCAGPKGAITRIVNPLLGAYLVFCNDGYNAASDMSQLELTCARQIFENARGWM